MNRETLIIPEKKEVIKSIKKDYNDLYVSNTKSKRIGVSNSILLSAASNANVELNIDIFLPEVHLGLEDILLNGISNASTTENNIVENEYEELANRADNSVKEKEINSLTNIINKLLENK